MSDLTQCICNTEQDIQCRRTVMAHTTFCWQHQNCSSRLVLDASSKGMIPVSQSLPISIQMFPEYQELVDFRYAIPIMGIQVTRGKTLNYQVIEEINKILNQALIAYENDRSLDDVMRTTDLYGDEFSKHASTEA